MPPPTKPDLRTSARAKRRTLHRDQPDFSATLAARADMLCKSLWPQACRIAGYAAVHSEADPAALMAALAARGHKLALPCVIAPHTPLTFRAYTPDAPLFSGCYGINEPAAEAESVIPDVVLVPLLAFDATGFRLGYGGGYYDRTIAQLRENGPVQVIGIAYRGQEIPSTLPGPHDQRLDGLIDEIGLHLFPDM